MMRKRSSIVAAVAVGFAAWLTGSAVNAQTEDPYGRSPDRVLRGEDLNRAGRESQEEQSRIDRLSLEQKEMKALAVVVFEPGEDGELKVDVKVRRGGEGKISMKGVKFDFGENEDQEAWTATSGTFAPPKKWKPLTVEVTPPGHASRKVVCKDTKQIASEDRVVFCIIPLMSTGDLYCTTPEHVSTAASFSKT